MFKKGTTRRLALSRRTLRQLTTAQTKRVVGGVTVLCADTNTDTPEECQMSIVLHPNSYAYTGKWVPC